MPCEKCQFPSMCNGSFCIVDDTPKANPSSSLYIQRIGRGTRVVPVPAKPTVVDYIPKDKLPSFVRLHTGHLPHFDPESEVDAGIKRMVEILKPKIRKTRHGDPVPVTVIPKPVVNISLMFILAILSFSAGLIVGSRGNRPDSFHVYVPPAKVVPNAAPLTLEQTDPKY